MAKKSNPPAVEIARQHVKSSQISSIGYMPDLMLLQVEFQNGAIYNYWPVREALYLELMAADSKGKYFSQNIKNSRGLSYERIK